MIGILGICRLKLGAYYTHWLHIFFFPVLPVFAEARITTTPEEAKAARAAGGIKRDIHFVTTEDYLDSSGWMKLLMFFLMFGMVAAAYCTAIILAVSISDSSSEGEGIIVGLLVLMLAFIPLAWAMDSKDRDDGEEPRGLNWRTPIWALVGGVAFVGLLGIFLLFIIKYMESH